MALGAHSILMSDTSELGMIDPQVMLKDERGNDICTFDSFECAIHVMAPNCAHCGCKVIGHGAEHEDRFYCCAHCARKAGVKGLDDRV